MLACVHLFLLFSALRLGVFTSCLPPLQFPLIHWDVSGK